MVDFDKLARERHEQKYDYLYQCDSCGERSWRWFELPPALLAVCATFPYRSNCGGPLALVGMRKRER